MTGSLHNTHWYGSIDKLSPDIKYIGRPGPYGNSFSSKNGDLSKEDCVAFHRVDLYRQLIDEPGYFLKLKQELDGRDLACWCAIKNKYIACHGLNYLHIFKAPQRDRDYTKTVFDYLVEDLLSVMSGLKTVIDTHVPKAMWLEWYIAFDEARMEITEVFRLFKERETPAYLRCVWLATFIIDLELALADPDCMMRLYRLDRVTWNAFRFTYRPTSRDGEPAIPGTKVRTPKVKKEKA